MARAYKDFLSDIGVWHPNISGLNFKAIGRDVAAKMEDPFTMKEVLQRYQM